MRNLHRRAGHLTTDPRLVPEAQLMRSITCDEMLELASLGAKVLHPRAVEIARNYGMPLVVRSSWSDDPGTRVIAPLPPAKSLDGLELAHPVDAVEFDPIRLRSPCCAFPIAPALPPAIWRNRPTKPEC
jgi:aspartate kinase